MVAGVEQVNLHAMTAGVAMLSLYTWLLGMKRRLLAAGRGCLPGQLAIVTDKGKGSKEQGNLVVKEAVSAMVAGWRAPFRSTCRPHYSFALFMVKGVHKRGSIKTLYPSY